jgi:hypothetical protein
MDQSVILWQPQGKDLVEALQGYGEFNKYLTEKPY